MLESGRPYHAVIFMNVPAVLPSILLSAFTRVLEQRPNCKGVDLVLTGRRVERIYRATRTTMARSGEDVAGLIHPESHAKQHGFGYKRVVDDGINEAEFINWIKARPAPVLGITLHYDKILSPELLDAMQASINYHPGLLGAHRGLQSTGWSLYDGDTATGYSFHYINEEIDQGNILIQDAIGVDRSNSYQWHENEKIRHAAGRVDELLDLVEAGDTGHAPEQLGPYHSDRDFRSVAIVETPETLTASEIEKRIWAFGRIWIGRHLVEFVRTRIQDSARPQDGPSIRTADGKYALINPRAVQPEGDL